MKRSEINEIIQNSKDFFVQQKFSLPVWAHWAPNKWEGKYDMCSEIIYNKLGWDITDFGSGSFEECGLVLFTIRNGRWGANDKTYCEKIMIAEVGQETPLHFHWEKSEDIINRGGGNLVIELFYATEDDKLSDSPVDVKIDGIKTRANPGEQVILYPGQSICLKPRVYHRFYGQKEKVLIGEVSAVNNDETDNRFFNDVGRFPDIDEDTAPLHLLVSDYKKYI